MIKTTSMIFNTEMVRALLAGNKTQTRRIFKQPKGSVLEEISLPWLRPTVWFPEKEESVLLDCPFGKGGDLIAVRETFAMIDMGGLDGANWCEIYKADQERPEPSKWKPSIHMPNEISRLTLKIADVRVERIQDISEQDAKAEGLRYHHLYNEWGGLERHPASSKRMPQWRWYEKPQDAFKHLWNSVYPDSWNKNEWVWVMDFEVIHKNIDRVLEEMEQAA